MVCEMPLVISHHLWTARCNDGVYGGSGMPCDRHSLCNFTSNVLRLKICQISRCDGFQHIAISE